MNLVHKLSQQTTYVHSMLVNTFKTLCNQIYTTVNTLF
jgi:hypothetical protein